MTKLLFCGFFILSVLAGVALARVAIWQREAERAGLDVAVGVAFAPFLIGILAVACLSLLPGLAFHAWVCAAGCILIAAVAYPLRSPRLPGVDGWLPFGSAALFAAALATLFALFGGTISAPFYANDALEYATVAKELARTNSIWSYPLINPTETLSGFFGPWTHPPLYPATLYFVGLVHGTPDATVYMKIVAFGFSAVTVTLVITLGRLMTPAVGFAAALLMLLAPLFRDSIMTSLIDALPTAGLLLVVALHIGQTGSPMRRGLFSGIGLGLALWTHSQAILFIPLFLCLCITHYGLRGLRSAASEAATAIAVTLLIAAWPYYRNIVLFGSPISDNPAIFALPSLDWDSYFSYARGLTSDMARLQYGVFKGWFARPSFSSLFWIATPGLILIIYRLAKRYREIFSSGSSGLPIALRLQMNLVVIFAFYFVGMALSTLAGIDLMIKNDRYLIVVVPAAALIGAIGLVELAKLSYRWATDQNRRPLTRETAGIIGIAALAVVLLRPTSAWVLEIASSFSLKSLDAASFLKRTPNLSSVRWLHDFTPQSATVLAMRPSDMYYSDRKMISYLDPRLLGFYSNKEKIGASATLRNLGITHIQIPDYYIPPVYNSSLEDIAADPSVTTLVYDRGMAQIYDLQNSEKTAKAAVDLSPRRIVWQRIQSTSIPGVRNLGLRVEAQPYTQDERSVGQLPFGLFNRDFSTTLRSETQPVTLARSGAEYLATIDLSGNGFVRVWIRFGLAGTYRLAELVLTDAKPSHQIKRRFCTASAVGEDWGHRRWRSLGTELACAKTTRRRAPCRMRQVCDC